jgi:thiol-disulfide isomerase/thioredoxin
MLRVVKKNKELLIIIFLLFSFYLYYKNTRTVDKFENDNEEGGLELMYFSATWCGHCNDFKPIWNKLVKYVNNSSEYKNKIKLVNYDSDKDKKMFSTYNVKQFPTILLKKKNGTTTEFKGDRDNIDTLKLFINKHI